MATPQLVFDINDKNELIRIHGINGGRQTKLATIDKDNGVIFWKDAECRDAYHKSVDAYLSVEKVAIHTVLMEGQTPDVVPKNAPTCPPMHKMQGDLTPAYLEWVLKYQPVKFDNMMGVKHRALEKGEETPTDIRELWFKADVTRIHVQPLLATHGGEYLSVKFIARDQIIARRKSHLTFEEKEILKESRDPVTNEVIQVTAEPYEDRYSPDLLEKAEKAGKIEVVWKRHAAATAGSIF